MERAENHFHAELKRSNLRDFRSRYGRKSYIFIHILCDNIIRFVSLLV